MTEGEAMAGTTPTWPDGRSSELPLRLLVFGSTGQVATELRRAASDTLMIDALPRAAAELSDPEACARAVAERQPDAVVNAAAYTNVDRAEAEEDLATIVNAAAPAAMAAAAAALGIPFLHLSTDFVFDGEADAPLREDAPTAPLGAYGRSKLEGERAVLAANAEAVILRVTRVFAAHGTNWVRTMLRAARTNAELRVVEDQVSAPTAAADIADVLIRIARIRRLGGGEGGTFHFCSCPAVSMYDFTRTLFDLAPWSAQPRLLRSKTSDWPAPARRPLRPLMDCARIAAVYGVDRPDWRTSLASVLLELKDRPD